MIQYLAAFNKILFSKGGLGGRIQNAPKSFLSSTGALSRTQMGHYQAPTYLLVDWRGGYPLPISLLPQHIRFDVSMSGPGPGSPE